MLVQLQTPDGKIVTLKKADTFGLRFFGLMGKDETPIGLWLIPCSSIHTFMMRFELDVVFLNKSQEIVSIHNHLRPGKTALGGKGAYSAIEFASSLGITEKLLPGMHLSLQQL